MAEIVTIGETMASFVPERNGFLRYAKSFYRGIAGAESNLAIYVSRFGHQAVWVSRLGEDEFGHYIRNAVRAEGVDTSRVRFSAQDPSGVMFRQVRPGRESSVFYYRAQSAASKMDESDVPEEEIRQARVLHLTGITPVLSDSCARMVKKAVHTAKACGCLFSFDPNIRRKLWQDRDFTGLIRELCLRADILIMGREEAEWLFGESEEQRLYERLFREGEIKYGALKNGSQDTVVMSADERIRISPYPCCCVDPIGAGDAFNAGFLCGLLEEKSLEECGHMGAAAGAMAAEGYGDTDGCPSREYLDMIIGGGKEVAR